MPINSIFPIPMQFRYKRVYIIQVLQIALHLPQVCTICAVNFLPRATIDILMYFCSTRLSITSVLRADSITSLHRFCCKVSAVCNHRNSSAILLHVDVHQEAP